jgi:hypothetical protein
VTKTKTKNRTITRREAEDRLWFAWVEYNYFSEKRGYFYMQRLVEDLEEVINGEGWKQEATDYEERHQTFC